MEAAHPLVQIARRLVEVREDERALADVVRHFPVETRLDISRASLLAALDDQRAHLARGAQLLLEPVVDIALRRIELQRPDRTGLGADLQAFFRVM